MRIQYLAHYRANPAPGDAEWPQIARAFSAVTPDPRPKDELPAWVPASLRDPSPPPKGSRYRTARFANNVEAVNFLVLDADHLTAEQWRDVRAKLEPFEYVYHSTYSHDPLTPPHEENGRLTGGASYRIILPMTAPVPGEQWSELYQMICASFGKDDLDHKTCDPSRLYYLPYCPPERASLAEAGHHPGAVFDSTAALEIVRQQAQRPITEPGVPGSLRYNAAGLPDRTIRVTAGDLPPIIERLEKARGAQTEEKRQRAVALRAVMAGRPFADAGARNATALSLVGTIIGHFKGASPESLVELFRPSLASMDEPTEDEIYSMAERYYSPMDDNASESLIQDAFAPTRRSHPYTAEELSDFAGRAGCTVMHFGKTRWIIQHARTYYLFFNGEYVGPFGKEDLPAQAVKYLSPAVSAGVQTSKVAGQDALGRPQWVPKGTSDLVADYGQAATRTRIEMFAPKSYYDIDTQTLVEVPNPLRDLRPEYDHSVDEWLRAMCGKSYQYVVDWIATVTDLRQAAPALYLYGAPKRGKSVLATRLAALWAQSNTPTSLQDAMTRFNDAILRCPIVFGDESIPRDSKGVPRTDDLRELISSTSHRLERKFGSVTSIDGAVRVILSANNKELIQARSLNLGSEDIDAIADRLIAVNVPYSVPPLTRATVERWDDNLSIPRHALWLRDNHAAAEGERFVCRAYGEALAIEMSVSAGIRDELMQHIYQAIRELAVAVEQGYYGRGYHGVAVREGVGDVWVCPGQIVEHRAAFNAIPPRASAALIRSAIRGLGRDESMRLKGHDGVRRQYRAIDCKRLYAWVEHADEDVEELQKMLARIATPR